MPLNPGDVLKGRYTISDGDLLGKGGMGAVYRAHDNLYGTDCALKELTLDHLPTKEEITRLRAGDGGARAGGARPRRGMREAAIALFQREAQLLAKLEHRNLPKVFDYFEENDNYYLVMTLIQGENLADKMGPDGDQPLPERQVVEWMNQVLDALEYCHQNQVVHRDVKPSNIIVTSERKVFLVDFGIARSDSLGGALSLSVPVGTRDYCPPEQYSSGSVDARSDIYSVGATMYRLLTGEIPLDAGSRSSGTKLSSPRAIVSTVSPAVDAAVMKALELHRDRRFQTITEFRRALKRKPRNVGRVVLWACMALAVVIGASLAFRWNTLAAVAFIQTFAPGPVRPTATTGVMAFPPVPKVVESTREILGPPAPGETTTAPSQTPAQLSSAPGSLPSASTLAPSAAPSPTSTPTPTTTPTLTFPPTITPRPTPFVRVSGDNVNLRSGPSTTCAVVGRAARGEVLAIVGRDPSGQWWQVRTRDGAAAWIVGSLALATGTDLVPTKPVTPCPPRPTATAVPTSNAPPPTEHSAVTGSTFCPHPGSCIVDPRNDETILGVTTVRGRATCSDFLYYKVEYLPEGGTTWGVLRIRYQPVEGSDGVLMEWHTTTVSPGVYLLRLTVVDKTGNYLPQAIIRVVVIR